MLKKIGLAFVILLLWFTLLAAYHTHKKMPTGLNYISTEHKINDSELEFIYDLTYPDSEGKVVYEQKIFDYIFEVIDSAEKYILIDMFLFNSYQTTTDDSFRELSAELTEILVKKKKEYSDIKIDLITDPINTVYGGSISPEIESLREAGVNVIISDVSKLKDSNFIYSSVWRTFIQWFGNSSDGGFVRHPFSNTEKSVTLRSYFNLLNFKANHRKVLVADNNNDIVSIISSANPHNGSSGHSNVALAIRGAAWESIFETELAVAKMSDSQLASNNQNIDISKEPNGTIQILSESQIKKAILAAIENAEPGDNIMIAQFYIADRDIIKAILAASKMGVLVDMIFDPNKDAFGYEKNGIPNRPVAYELVKKSENNINVRWYNTHGEQFHSKLFILKSNNKLTAILGSANLTRRNLDNYNLELNAKIIVGNNSEIAESMLSYFSRIFNNENGEFTVEYDYYADESMKKYLLYRLQEKLGLSTF